MDFDAAAGMPPIPPRTHNHLRLHPRFHPRSFLDAPQQHQQQPTLSSPSASRPSTTRALGKPPADNEVITSLITSLSALPSPPYTHFDPCLRSTSLSLPTSPITRSSGSLGGDVEYGVYSASSLTSHRADDGNDFFDETTGRHPPLPPLSIPPTSTYMSGSTSQDQRNSSRDSASHASLLEPNNNSTSRPSSRGSSATKNDDTFSIGNLSIERGSAAPRPELKSRKSLDSWCRRASRGSKILMYSNSKEGTRDMDKRRSSGSVTPVGSGSIYHGARTDYFSADHSVNGESFTAGDCQSMDSPCFIPARDSSLRKTDAGRKLSVSGSRRPKRDSDGTISDPLRQGFCGVPDGFRACDLSTIHRRVNSDIGKTHLYGVDENSPTVERASSLYHVEMFAEEDRASFEDDGAPFPSVSQNRRRDEPTDRSSRRLSDRLSAFPNDHSQHKRSTSRLKRLSVGITSPVIDRRSSNDDTTRTPSGYERPKSADSVDDAVESYLCSPRLSQKIRHPQTGRLISFSEVGDPEGSAVFCCVGMGLTRYITAFYDELALTLKLRLITPDRPGVGGSEPCPDGTTTPLSWPDDVYAICQALKITKFSILAHSAGAIYALATALRMPQHIRGRIHLLAPWIPPSQMNVFGTSQAQPPSAGLPTSQRILRALPTPILKAANSSFMSATSNSFASAMPKNPRRQKRKTAANAKDSSSSLSQIGTPSFDNQSLNGIDGSSGAVMEPQSSESVDKVQRPGSAMTTGSTYLEKPMSFETDKERQKTYDLRLTHAIWELATTNANPAVDLLICLERQHPIGFRYVDITRPVIIHHGSKDNRVPVENVKWLGRAMRRCEVRVLEQEGHGLMASATVMGSVLMEISKEWDDWIRATTSDERNRQEKSR